jgi:hypothetical protein
MQQLQQGQTLTHYSHLNMLHRTGAIASAAINGKEVYV